LRVVKILGVMAKMSREGGVKELKSQKERKVENKKDTL
jgi:hypothetical protein